MQLRLKKLPILKWNVGMNLHRQNPFNKPLRRLLMKTPVLPPRPNNLWLVLKPHRCHAHAELRVALQPCRWGRPTWLVLEE